MLDQAVWTDACELLRNPILLRREYESRLASPESSDTERSLQKQIANFQRTMNRLIDIHTDGLIDRDEFEPRMERARKRHAELSSKFESLVTQSRDQSATREALACIDSLSEAVCANLDQAPWNTRREILRTLIERVQIAPNQIRIIYRINFPLFVKKASNAKSSHFCWRSEMTTLTRFLAISRTQHRGTRTRSNPRKPYLSVESTESTLIPGIAIRTSKFFGDSERAQRSA